MRQLHHVRVALSSDDLPTGKTKLGPDLRTTHFAIREIAGGTIIVPSAFGLDQRYWILILRAVPRTPPLILMSDGSPRVTIFLINFSLLFFGVTWSISFCKLLSFLQPAPLSLLLSNSRICFDLLVLLSIFGVQRIRSSSAFFFSFVLAKKKRSEQALIHTAEKNGDFGVTQLGQPIMGACNPKRSFGIRTKAFCWFSLGRKNTRAKILDNCITKTI